MVGREMKRAPVLVVGGRTTGLMMASELVRHGVDARVIDASPGIDPHVRANLLHSRTLEIFLGLGIAEEATHGSFPEHGIRVYVNGALVGENRHEPVDSPFPFGMSQSQAHTEAVLQSHLERLGVSVERGVRLRNLAARDDDVRATLVHEDGHEERVEAPWLIGCDGAHSTVRQLTGSFPGKADPYWYVLADVVVEGKLEENCGYLFLHDDGDLFVFSTLPERRRLVCANLPTGLDPTEPPTLAAMQHLVDRRGVPGLRLSDPRWLTHFRIHYRLAPHYRHGRVFLAGDAAHVHSLLAGQGMNTGIQDAYNLGWKLALVMKGLAPEWWLDTYELERRKIARDVINMTRAMTDETELFAKLSPKEREKVIAHMLIPDSMRTAAAEALQEVDLDYRTSPLCIDTRGFESGPHAGSRAPDASPIIVNGRPGSLFDRIGGTKHRLFFFEGKSSEATDDIAVALGELERQRSWLDTFVVGSNRYDAATAIDDPQGVLHERYGAEVPCLYLIRPDGYVAYRSLELRSLSRYLDHVHAPRHLPT